MSKYSIAIVGAGKVGSALAIVLDRAGYKITGVASRSLDSAMNLAKRFQAVATTNISEVTSKADIVLITTPDSKISDVAKEMIDHGGVHAEQFVFHVCGSQSAESLSCIRKACGKIGSMHPLQAFADGESAADKIVGTYFAIDGDREARQVATELVTAIGGKNFFVPSEQRALYHAAACMASNYTVAIVHGAVQMLEKLGIEEKAAIEALTPIMQGTFENIRQVGTVKALTGPIVRGDVITIKNHIEEIADLSPEESTLYTNLGIYTQKIAQKRGGLSEKQNADLSTAFRSSQLSTEIRKNP